MQRYIHSTTQTSIIKPGSRIFIKHLLSMSISLFLLGNDTDRAIQNCVKKVKAIYSLGKKKVAKQTVSYLLYYCC